MPRAGASQLAVWPPRVTPRPPITTYFAVSHVTLYFLTPVSTTPLRHHLLHHPLHLHTLQSQPHCLVGHFSSFDNRLFAGMWRVSLTGSKTHHIVVFLATHCERQHWPARLWEHLDPPAFPLPDWHVYSRRTRWSFFSKSAKSKQSCVKILWQSDKYKWQNMNAVELDHWGPISRKSNFNTKNSQNW